MIIKSDKKITKRPQSKSMYQHPCPFYNEIKDIIFSNSLYLKKMKLEELTDTARDVLKVFIDFVLSCQRVSPSMEYMGKLVHKTERSVRTAVKLLRKLGIIETVNVGARKTYVYFLNPVIFEHHILEKIMKLYGELDEYSKWAMDSWRSGRIKHRGLLTILIEAYEKNGTVLTPATLFAEKKKEKAKLAMAMNTFLPEGDETVFQDILLRKPAEKRRRIPKVLSKLGIAIMVGLQVFNASAQYAPPREHKTSKVSQIIPFVAPIGRYPKGVYRPSFKQRDYVGNIVSQELLQAFPESYQDDWVPNKENLPEGYPSQDLSTVPLEEAIKLKKARIALEQKEYEQRKKELMAKNAATPRGHVQEKAHGYGSKEHLGKINGTPTDIHSAKRDTNDTRPESERIKEAIASTEKKGLNNILGGVLAAFGAKVIDNHEKKEKNIV